MVQSANYLVLKVYGSVSQLLGVNSVGNSGHFFVLFARSKELKEAHINTYYNVQHSTLNRVERVKRRLCLHILIRNIRITPNFNLTV